AGRLFFFQAEDGIRNRTVTGVQTCALPISSRLHPCNNDRADGNNEPCLFHCSIPLSRDGSRKRSENRPRLSGKAGRRSAPDFTRSEERRVGKERKNKV